MTIRTKVYHDKASMWHNQKKLDFHNASTLTELNRAVQTNTLTHMQRHMRIFSVINLVYHNDLTKIVNTITYCERANHKNPRQLRFKKIKGRH